MSKVARVRAALRGEPVDRPPINFWFHFGVEDEPPSLVADLHLDLFRGFDLDWLKIMHDYPFGDISRMGAVKSPAELARLRPVAPNDGGFRRQLEVLARIAEAVGGDAWFVDTVFSPWSIGQMLTGGQIADWLREEPASVSAGLGVIAESLSDYVPATVATGVAGVFYVVDGYAAEHPAYQEHVAPLDIELLALASGNAFNVLHVHGVGADLAVHAHQPVHAVSASVGCRTEQAATVRERLDCALISGLDERETLPRGTPDAIRREVHRSAHRAGRTGLLIAPGCALRPGIPEENLWAAREAVETLDSTDFGDSGPID